MVEKSIQLSLAKRVTAFLETRLGSKRGIVDYHNKVFDCCIIECTWTEAYSQYVKRPSKVNTTEHARRFIKVQLIKIV